MMRAKATTTMTMILLLASGCAERSTSQADWEQIPHETEGMVPFEGDSWTPPPTSTTYATGDTYDVSTPPDYGTTPDYDNTVYYPSAPVAPVDTLANDLEFNYVVGPNTARDLGYRIDWQYPAFGRAISKVTIEGDSVLALDSANTLVRLDRDTGRRIWRLRVVEPIEQIFGVTYIPEDERIFLTTGSAFLVLDDNSGSRIAKQKLERTANTTPVRVGRYLVYGSRDGQLAWHAHKLNATVRGYQISNSILIPPVVSDNVILTVGLDGTVMALRADSARQIWKTRTLARVASTPAAGDGVGYVSSLDQHLRAYDLTERRAPLWSYLTESPLTDSPVLLGDRLYQQVPSEGLVCLEAQPLDRPGGSVIWTAPNVQGSVVAKTKSGLVTWDATLKTIALLDSKSGAVKASFDAPHIDQVIPADSARRGLIVTGTDGRISRLLPRRGR